MGTSDSQGWVHLGSGASSSSSQPSFAGAGVGADDVRGDYGGAGYVGRLAVVVVVVLGRRWAELEDVDVAVFADGQGLRACGGPEVRAGGDGDDGGFEPEVAALGGA